MKTSSLCIGLWVLLALWLPPLAAQDFEGPNCTEAFGLSPSHLWPPITPQHTVVTPAIAKPGKKVMVCVISLIDADHTSITRDGNRITYTIYDSGFSWGPNPTTIYADQFGPLPAGNYVLDTVFDSGWQPGFGASTFTAAHDVPFMVLAGDTTVPTSSGGMLGWLAAALALMGLLAIAGRQSAFASR